MRNANTSSTPTPPPRIARHAIRAGYIGVVILATLTQLQFDPDTAAAWTRLNLAFAPSIRSHEILDAIRNIALFGGLGTVIYLTSTSNSLANAVRESATIGFIVSIAVEAVQTFSPVRVASIVDIGMDTAGTVIGVAMAYASVGIVRVQRRQRLYFGVPAIIFAGAYSGAVVLEAIAPRFRPDSLSVRSGGILERLAMALTSMKPAEILDVHIVEVVLFVPAGFFVIAALIEARFRYADAWRLVAIVAAIVTVSAEVIHGAAGYPIVSGAVVGHWAGTMIGVWWARWIPERPTASAEKTTVVRILVAYAIVLMIWSWRPFRLRGDWASIASQLSADHLVPIQAQAEYASVFGIADVIIQFLLFVPVGSVLTFLSHPRSRAVVPLLPALAMIITLEAGQILIADRFFDVTDVLIQFAGVAIGWVVTRRAAFAPDR